MNLKKIKSLRLEDVEKQFWEAKKGNPEAIKNVALISVWKKISNLRINNRLKEELYTYLFKSVSISAQLNG